MAEYEGKEVKLNDPFRLPSGSKKKFGVYVKNPKTGNVIKVEFGDPNLSIKRDDPERLKNFRARHNCDQKTDKTTPGYWSCKFWEKDKPVSKLLKKGKVESVGEGCGCDECMSEDKHDKKGKDMDPRKHVALSKKNPGMYCVFDVKGREVKLFKKKSDAEAYAIKNHDELMKESVNESRKKKITYVINRRTGEVVYGPTDVADAKQFLKKQPQPRKFVIRDIRESVQLDEQGSIVKTFGNTRDYMPLIKKFGMEKQFRSMMRDLKKFGESGDGLIMIYSDKMLEFIIEPLEDSHYVTKAAQRGGPMTGKNLVKKDVRARGAKGVDARVIAFKESEYNPLDEQSYVPGQAKAAHGGASRRGGSRGPRMSRQRKNRAEVLDQLVLNGIQVLNQPQVVTGKGGSDTFVVAKKDVKKAKKVLDDYFEKAYVKIHMGKKGLRRDNYTIVAEGVNLDEQKIRTQVEFDSLTDAVKSVKFHPTRDKGREVAIYKLTPPKRTMRTSAERPSGKKVGSVDFQKKTVYTTVTLPNGPFEKILKAKGAKRIATVKNVDGKAKVLKEQVKSMDQKKAKKIYDKLKKGSEIEVNFGNFMHSGGKPIVLKVTSGHRIVGKSKVGRIILVNPENPRGMKYKLFNRDGNISLAQGDMATILKDMNIIKEQRVIQESGHEDVPSAKNKVMMNLVSLRKIHKILCCMDPHASLPSWLTDKLTIATSKLDTVGDYLESQVMQSESTDPNFWLIELNEDEDDKKKKGKNPRGTKYYTKSGRIKKSPEDKETGLPKKYVSRMTDADAKQKAAEIKARKKYDKDDPRRYKPTEVDKKYAGKGQKSKYTKAYDKMFGKDDD